MLRIVYLFQDDAIYNMDMIATYIVVAVIVFLGCVFFSSKVKVYSSKVPTGETKKHTKKRINENAESEIAATSEESEWRRQ